MTEGTVNLILVSMRRFGMPPARIAEDIRDVRGRMTGIRERPVRTRRRDRVGGRLGTIAKRLDLVEG